MAVKNEIRKATQSEQAMVYMVNGAEVKLTPNIVKSYLVAGDGNNVTMPEVVMFMNICKANGLNPWLREAYCIKYGNSPATMVVGKEAYLKRAETSPDYDGMQAGIIVRDEDGAITYRDGTFYDDGEAIVGGWAKVYRKNRTYPTIAEVSMKEYEGKKKDGSRNGQWAAKPATMIRKVALVQALREAFPQSIVGIYAAEELGYAEEEIPATVYTPEQVATMIEEQPKAQAPTPAPEKVKEPEPVAQQMSIQDAFFGGNR